MADLFEVMPGNKSWGQDPKQKYFVKARSGLANLQTALTGSPGDDKFLESAGDITTPAGYLQALSGAAKNFKPAPREISYSQNFMTPDRPRTPADEIWEGLGMLPQVPSSWGPAGDMGGGGGGGRGGSGGGNGSVTPDNMLLSLLSDPSTFNAAMNYLPPPTPEEKKQKRLMDLVAAMAGTPEQAGVYKELRRMDDPAYAPEGWEYGITGKDPKGEVTQQDIANEIYGDKVLREDMAAWNRLRGSATPAIPERASPGLFGAIPDPAAEARLKEQVASYHQLMMNALNAEDYDTAKMYRDMVVELQRTALGPASKAAAAKAAAARQYPRGPQGGPPLGADTPFIPWWQSNTPASYYPRGPRGG